MTLQTLSETPVSVYRSYDVDEYLIYVGITSRGYARSNEHAATSAWWPHVALQRIDHYASRREAEAVEAALIRAYRPPYNVVHNIGGAELRAAYETSRKLQDRPASALLAAVKYRVPLKHYATTEGLATFTAPIQFGQYFRDAEKTPTAALRDSAAVVLGSVEDILLTGPVPTVRVRLLDPLQPLPPGMLQAKFQPAMRSKDRQIRLASISYRRAT